MKPPDDAGVCSGILRDWPVTGLTAQKERERPEPLPRRALAGRSACALPPRGRLRLEVRAEGAADDAALVPNAEYAAGQLPRADDAQRAVLVLLLVICCKYP